MSDLMAINLSTVELIFEIIKSFIFAPFREVLHDFAAGAVPQLVDRFINILIFCFVFR